MTDKRPLCGECVDGFVVDPESLLPVRRCECRYREITPREAREQGMAATSEANPDALKAALAIIREAALAAEFFSSNDVRHRMTLAQVPGPTVGAAFGQAVRNGWIRRDGYVPSTDPGTHGHEVKRWASLICRPAAGRTVA